MLNILSDPGFNIALQVIFICISLLWIISVIITNSSIIDIFWGTAYAISAFIYFYFSDKNINNMLLMSLAMFQGIRLSVYLAFRNLGHGEDKRYVKLFRSKNPKNFWWISFFQVFFAQMVLNLLVNSNIRFYMRTQSYSVNHEYNTELNIYTIIGSLLMFGGSILQAVADQSLYNFKADASNQGKLLTTGVWSLCRHPNYFGESLFWWGVYFFNLSVGQWWCIYSPAFMTFLLIKVSGVRILEKQMKKENKYGSGYDDYLNNTAVFVPFIY